MIVTLSQRGYVKRVPPSTFRQQNRGGKGVRGMTTREGDAILDLLVVDTHSRLFFFTNRGRVYPMKALPDSRRRLPHFPRDVAVESAAHCSETSKCRPCCYIENPEDEYASAAGHQEGADQVTQDR